LLREGEKLALLVLSKLDGEDLAADAVLELVVALPRDVLYGRPQGILDQLLFDLETGLYLACEETTPAPAC
jgi:hypothetical protein